MPMVRRLLATLAISFAAVCAYADTTSKDAYIRSRPGEWVIGTRIVQKTIRLQDGHLEMASFRNNVNQREYVQGGGRSAEFRLVVDSDEITGITGGWSLVHERSRTLDQGELELELALSRGPLQVTKYYVVYPGTAVVREWATVRNTSERSLRLSEPSFMEAQVLGSDADGLDLYYVTGGGNYNGSQLLKKEKMGREYARVFDSKIGIQTESYSAYLPLIVLRHEATNDGIMMGWDYLGHWNAHVGNDSGHPVHIAMQVAGYSKDLAPGAQMETPKAFMAAFSGDLDAMGNSLLDWQYGYLWDLTNPDYFAKTRWAVDWPDPWIGVGGTPSADNWGRRLALDLRYVDLMRATGTDVLWDDAGWYDRWGTWNGPDWRLTTDYLRKQSMKFVLWIPTFLAHPLSKVAQLHPDWLIPGQQVLEQSIPATADWQRGLLDQGVKDWGDFQFRYDIAPAVSGNDTDYLASDQNFRQLLERFKREHKDSGVDACYGGGRWISYDIARLSESGEYTDGGVGPYSGYYTSLLVPPDKYHNVVDFDHTYYSPASDRAHLSINPTWYRDPGDGPDTEAIRKDWEIYHYLAEQGVVGRWSHVFRPSVEHDDPIWYFQRMDRENSKGVIITKHSKGGPAYYLISKPIGKGRPGGDFYSGNAGSMTRLTTTTVASIDTGVYEDPIDGQYRFYGVPGESYGPLNFKYQSSGSDVSFVTAIAKYGAQDRAKDRFFGMSIQVANEPLTVTQLGQLATSPGRFDAALNQGIVRLSVVRTDDNTIVGSADLDMSQGNPDAMGFKYVKLANPIRLDAGPGQPVVVHPHGLSADAAYDVSCAKSNCTQRRSGADLAQNGIKLASVQPGELIYLNLPSHPGSGRDKTPPQPPSNATKRIGTNLGWQGIEVAWSPGKDDNWISYYELLRNGARVATIAKGTFFFDRSGDPLELIKARYEVRTVDGDGNRSDAVPARPAAGDPESYRALGGFSATQGWRQWRYDEALGDVFHSLTWSNGGYEGRWTGSGAAKIGRIWMQPGASSDVARTFVAPAAGVLAISANIRKDPSSENGRSVGARILHNGRQIWPANGWAEIPPDYSREVACRLDEVRVNAGDLVRFVLRHTGSDDPDPVIWDPIITVRRTQ